MFLEAIRRRRGARVDDDFPWTVPALRSLRELCFTAPVTFLMGENGCGKSTLLEALAVAVEARAAGAEEVDADATLAGSRRLAEAFEAVERGRPRNRVFFRAEDAFGFTKRIEREMKEIDAAAGRSSSSRHTPRSWRRSPARQSWSSMAKSSPKRRTESWSMSA